MSFWWQLCRLSSAWFFFYILPLHICLFGASEISLGSLSSAIHGPPPLSLTTPVFFYLDPLSRSRLPLRHVLESSGIGNGAAAGRWTEKVVLRRRPISRRTEADRITHVPYHRLSLDMEGIWNCKYLTRSVNPSRKISLVDERGPSCNRVLRKKALPVYLARAIDIACASMRTATKNRNDPDNSAIFRFIQNS